MEIRTANFADGLNWYVCGWRLFARSPGVWIALVLIFLGICIGLALVPFVGTLAFVLIMPALVAGFMYGARELERTGALELNHLFQGFADKPRTGPLLLLGAVQLGVSFLSGLVFFVGIGGSVMAVVMSGEDLSQDPTPMLQAVTSAPVVISVLIVLLLQVAILMLLLYSPMLVMLREAEPVQAMKASFSGCLRNWLPLLLFGIVYMVLAAVALIPFGLGLLLLAPVSICALYCSYKRIYE